MLRRRPWVFLAVSLCLTALCARPVSGQVFSTPGSNNSSKFGIATSIDAISSSQIDGNLFLINSQGGGANSPLQAPSGSVSKLDLKAPAKAQHEYAKGYQLLMKRDSQGAIASPRGDRTGIRKRIGGLGVCLVGS